MINTNEIEEGCILIIGNYKILIKGIHVEYYKRIFKQLEDLNNGFSSFNFGEGFDESFKPYSRIKDKEFYKARCIKK